jgi:hypothetical protein
MLGYKDTHHMQTVFANPLEAAMWQEAMDAKFLGKGKPYGREEWDQLLGQCQVRTLQRFSRKQTVLILKWKIGDHRRPGSIILGGAPGGVPRRQSDPDEPRSRKMVEVVQ